MSCTAVIVHGHGPSHPCNAGTEHVGFFRTRQALLAPSAKRLEATVGEGKPGPKTLVTEGEGLLD